MFALALFSASAHAAALNANPSNWCGVINGAATGSTVILAAGTYTDTCNIRASGSSGSPITIQSATPAPSDRATFTYAGSASNFMDVYGSYLTFRWLTFSPSADNGANPIKPRGGSSYITVDQNTFIGTDIIVPANDGGGVTYQGLIITNNIVQNCQSTGIYLGCHDGTSCHVLNSVVANNYINGTLPGDGVGYGMEIKLNSSVLIQNNTVLNAYGPGIMVYGSNRGDPPSIVERNYVDTAKTDAGINVGGGPAIVRNNIVMNGANFGIWAQDYNGRGLQQNVWIVNNTLLNNQSGGVGVQNWQTGAGNVMAYNAATPLSGTTAFPNSPGTLQGNVVCSPVAGCFDQSTTQPFDLWPLASGSLIGGAGSGSEAWRATDDFMCQPRGTSADTGAMQRTGSGSGPPLGGGNARPACSGTTPPPPPPSNSPCDVNRDGSTNVADVQLEVNMALGISPCTNSSGTCNVVSVQRVVNAALGGTCVNP